MSLSRWLWTMSEGAKRGCGEEIRPWRCGRHYACERGERVCGRRHHDDEGSGNSVQQLARVQLDRILCRRPYRLCLGKLELDREHAGGAGERLRLARFVSTLQRL